MTAAPSPSPSPSRADAENWAFYLKDNEKLLGVWRPDDEFRVYGIGKTMMLGCWVLAGVLIVGPLFLINYTSTSNVLLLGLGLAALGTILGYGPAWLDQKGRRARRYALSDRRVLEFQDIQAGRLRSVPIDQELRVIEIYNDKLDSYELSFVTLDQHGRAGRSVLFERLTEEQSGQIQSILHNSAGTEGSGSGPITLRKRGLDPDLS